MKKYTILYNDTKVLFAIQYNQNSMVATPPNTHRLDDFIPHAKVMLLARGVDCDILDSVSVENNTAERL